MSSLDLEIQVQNHHEIVNPQQNTPMLDVENPAIAYLMTLGSPKSRKTMKYYLQKVARIMTGQHDIRQCPWENMKRQHVQAVIESLRQAGRAPATINIYLTLLKSVAHEAWCLDKMSDQSYQAIKKIRGVKGQRLMKGRALSQHEIETLLLTCDRDRSSKGLRDAAMIAILIGCGLRRHELVSLDMQHVLWQDKALQFIGKGDKERLAFMPEGAFKRLHTWVHKVRGVQEGVLFPRIRRHDDVQDSRLSEQAIYVMLKSRAEESEIASFSPHDLRRTYATRLMDRGVDMMTVKDMMGHQSITTTQRYVRIQDEKMKKASQLLDL